MYELRKPGQVDLELFAADIASPLVSFQIALQVYAHQLSVSARYEPLTRHPGFPFTHSASRMADTPPRIHPVLFLFLTQPTIARKPVALRQVCLPLRLWQGDVDIARQYLLLAYPPTALAYLRVRSDVRDSDNGHLSAPGREDDHSVWGARVIRQCHKGRHDDSDGREGRGGEGEGVDSELCRVQSGQEARREGGEKEANGGAEIQELGG